MAPIRILLAGPPRLRAAFAEALTGAEDIRIAGVGTDPVEILLAADRFAADVVVAELGGDEVPGVATHLLAEFPHLKIFLIGARQTVLYELRPRVVPLEVTAAPDILREIRSAMHAGERR